MGDVIGRPAIMWPIRPLATCPATIGDARMPRAPRPLAVRTPDHWKRRAQGALWFHAEGEEVD